MVNLFVKATTKKIVAVSLGNWQSKYMDFYNYLQEYAVNDERFGRLTALTENLTEIDLKTIQESEERHEHKIWVHIVINHATNTADIAEFNDAWQAYQAARPDDQ